MHRCECTKGKCVSSTLASRNSSLENRSIGPRTPALSNCGGLPRMHLAPSGGRNLIIYFRFLSKRSPLPPSPLPSGGPTLEVGPPTPQEADPKVAACTPVGKYLVSISSFKFAFGTYLPRRVMKVSSFAYKRCASLR